MSNTLKALEVLERAKDQLIREIATCGTNGGVGRAQSYAAVLVNISSALDIVKKTLPAETPVEIDRMAAMRAAKAAKQAVEA